MDALEALLPATVADFCALLAAQPPCGFTARQLLRLGAPRLQL